MTKLVHVWEITCASCGGKFLHEFRASDLFRPHMFLNLYFKCPECGGRGFDRIDPKGKMSLEEWQEKHPDMGISDLPEYEDQQSMN